jgi:hypothetical protein
VDAASGGGGIEASFIVPPPAIKERHLHRGLRVRGETFDLNSASMP